MIGPGGISRQRPDKGENLLPMLERKSRQGKKRMRTGRGQAGGDIASDRGFHPALPPLSGNILPVSRHRPSCS